MLKLIFTSSSYIKKEGYLKEEEESIRDSALEHMFFPPRLLQNA